MNVGSNYSKSGGSPPGTVIPFQDPSDICTLEMIAERLHQPVSWVREKVRPRSPHPLPSRNIGRRLVFSWAEVSEWLRNSPSRLRHSAHRKRTKVEVARAVQGRKASAAVKAKAAV